MFENVSGWPTYEEFKTLKMKNGMHQMTIENLFNWLDINKDAYIITDIKNDNIKALEIISKSYKGYKKRFIPQIYFTYELKPVRELGYRNIILTLYKSKGTNEDIINFIKNNHLFAITMWPERAKNDSFAKILKEKGVFVYVHTLNSPEMMKDLKENGVSGFYTDFILPYKT